MIMIYHKIHSFLLVWRNITYLWIFNFVVLTNSSYNKQYNWKLCTLLKIQICPHNQRKIPINLIILQFYLLGMSLIIFLHEDVISNKGWIITCNIVHVIFQMSKKCSSLKSGFTGKLEFLIRKCYKFWFFFIEEFLRPSSDAQCKNKSRPKPNDQQY